MSPTRSALVASIAALSIACGGGSDGSAQPEIPVGDDPAAAPPEDPGPNVEPGHDLAHDPARDSGTDAAPAAARVLDTSVVSHIVEPEGSGHDDLGRPCTDTSYWNMCSAGAVAAALYSFRPNDVTAWPAGDFLEPSHAPSTIPAGGTYWKSSDTVNGYTALGRAYVMHIAMQSKPPSFSAPGVDSFATYPTTGGSLSDMRDVLNWEASGHAATWATFFYAVASASTLTEAKLHADVVKDIVAGHAVVAAVDTTYLPNWSRGLSHAIAVIGYSDTAGTYTYVDTCGVHCNGSANAKNGGTWALPQSKLYLAIKADGAGYVH